MTIQEWAEIRHFFLVLAHILELSLLFALFFSVHQMWTVIKSLIAMERAMGELQRREIRNMHHSPYRGKEEYGNGDHP